MFILTAYPYIIELSVLATRKSLQMPLQGVGRALYKGGGVFKWLFQHTQGEWMVFHRQRQQIARSNLCAFSEVNCINCVLQFQQVMRISFVARRMPD